MSIAAELAGEFPDLALWTQALECGSRESPPELKQRLRDLSDRFRGPQAVQLRTQPLPHAYRVFFRHIGLDPDVHRVPVEELAVERLKHGGFRSRNLLDDALVIATMETSVGVYALDTATLSGPISLRTAVEGEPLGRLDDRATPLPAGRLVVADELGAVAVLFGDIAPTHGVTPQTERILLFAVQVAGVPSIHVEEALWTVSELLED